MKKMVYMLSLLLPVALLANIGDAGAQRKNYTSHETRRSQIPAYDPASEQPNIPDAVSRHGGDMVDTVTDTAGDAYDAAAETVKGGWHDLKQGAKDMVSDDDDYDDDNRRVRRHPNQNRYRGDMRQGDSRRYNARRDNVRSTDGAYAGQRNYRDGKNCDCGCGNDRDCQGNCAAKWKKRWYSKKSTEISEEYNEAIQKINTSGFRADQKDLLIKQARENQDLAREQLKERADQRLRHAQQRIDMNMNAMMGSKANRKAVKKVEKIK